MSNKARHVLPQAADLIRPHQASSGLQLPQQPATRYFALLCPTWYRHRALLALISR
jgi:hypothetical protein